MFNLFCCLRERDEKVPIYVLNIYQINHNIQTRNISIRHIRSISIESNKSMCFRNQKLTYKSIRVASSQRINDVIHNG